MKKSFLIACGSIASAAVITAAGAVYSDEDGLLKNNNATFYSNFNVYNGLKFTKSVWPAGQTDNLLWKAENVQYDDGNLILKIDKDESGSTGGEISTKKKYGFGLYKVRMKPINNKGVVSSFFNYASEKEKGTEIDIEFLGYDTTKVQFNYYTDGVGGHEYLYDLGFDASKEFHEYSFDWSKDSIKWYVDGKLAHEANEDIPQIEANIFMDVWPGDDPGWLKEYDGTTPLYAYYDWCSFTDAE